MGGELVQEWFNHLEKVLAAEAELAGLLGHGTMVGNAREFFVSRVLRTFLPPILHIGTGRIVDVEGGESKQIDVIVYDPRFPMLGTEGGGNIYFAEGVIAAIEVKSKLTKKKLIEALDNCLSVMRLTLYGANRDEMDVFSKLLRVNQDLSEDEANQAAADHHTPFTYIFSYGSGLSWRSTYKAIGDWYRDNGQQATKRHVLLPRVIATGNSAALTFDAWFRLEESDLGRKQREDNFRNQDSRTVMEVYKTERRFGLLAAHLMSVASRRFGFVNGMTGVSYDLNAYFKPPNYYDKATPRACVVWLGEKSRTMNE